MKHQVVSIFSEKITEMVELSETEVFESAGEVDKTDGAFESTVKEVLARVLLAFPNESLTIIVQSE